MQKLSYILLIMLFIFSWGYAESDDSVVTIQWLGQSCFLMTTSHGTQILIDPAEFKGYHLPKGLTPDIVVISHNHIDHNNISTLEGNPVILYGCTADNQQINIIDTLFRDIKLNTVQSYHDPGKHGMNAISVIKFDSLRIVHLGDLGTTLTAEQIKAIGRVDFLMIPVGGKYTIAGVEADSVIEQLQVRHYILPMHYKTAAFDGLPYTVEDFLKDKENIHRITGNTLTIDPKHLSTEPEYIILDYKQPSDK